MMHNNNSIPNHPPTLEITIISAQDLTRRGRPSLAFCGRLRPFITLTAAKMYKTRVDERGGVNPTWGEKFEISLDHAFFYQGIYLQLHTKRLLMGQTQLGWCLVPASDIVSRLAPVGSTQFLSYRLRDRDGSRGRGIVNVAVRLQGSVYHYPSRPLISDDESVIGIPVKL
ncbi:hypothetical protein C2S53_006790 [Perilla frutescens var. hirtella]|uniref:C2 domain-containing protein n=1 Tax=Perilla frutescens var. hirtella TaxID=608512 RepID=A0AAD4P8M4_PERFH|nr:hypothetical protein C2S53_006790 [Perilla frutescens var. hirtella]